MARVSKVAAGVAARKGKAEKKIRTTNWFNSYLNFHICKSFFFKMFKYIVKCWYLKINNDKFWVNL